MIALTWFKNKTPTFFSFQNFYKKYWDIDNFIYCIGYTDNENREYILNRYFENCNVSERKKININMKNVMENIEFNVMNNQFFKFKLILYKTNAKTSIEEWNSIKNILGEIILPIIDKNEKLLVLDDDEFLYSNNIEKIKDSNNFRFHFMDYVCDETFDKNNLNWSIQYAAQTHCMYAEKDEAWKTYYCGNCVVFNFTKGSVWDHYRHHGGKDTSDSVVCKQFKFREKDAMDLNSKTDEELNKIVEEGVCFHLIGLNQNQLLDTKRNNRHSNGNWRLYDDEKKIQKLIRKNLRIVKNNLLSDIIDDKDIKDLNDLYP